MPLIFQTHRPPELQQEIRNLYREISKLDTDTASRFATVVAQIPEGNGNGEPVEGGTVYSWAQMVDLNIAPGTGWNTEVWDVAQIEALSYSHLEINVFVLRVSSVAYPQTARTYRWQVRGTSPFYLMKWNEIGIPDWQSYGAGGFGEQIKSIQYWWEMAGVGRFRPLPRFSAGDYPGNLSDPDSDWENWQHDLAYRPVAPEDGTDTLQLAWSYYAEPGDNCVTCKAWVIGRYIVHDLVQWGLLCPND